MLRRIARRWISVLPCLVAASLALASCDTLRRTAGLPGDVERRQATTPSKPVLVQPPATAPSGAASEATLPVIQEPEAAQDQPVKVAILLPLSGSLASLGKSMSDAAQMAMFDLADRRFQLMPIDDKGTANGSADAAKQAIADGARLILGPLLAPSVRSVAPLAAAAGVPVIAFSSDQKASSRGVHIIGFTPEAEVERVVGFAAGRGFNRFAALAPDNLYGAAVVDSFRKTVTASGGSIVRVLLYEPNTQEFGPFVRRLVGTAEAPPDAASFEAMLPPLPAFDALLVAEGGKQLKAIAGSIENVGVRPPGVQLLGTGKWDEPGIGAQANLIGAWFAAPAPVNREEFVVRYKRTFGQTPPRLATLAYDATALAAVLARGPERNPFAESSLTDPSGFFGRDGLFRLTTDGVVDRKLAIIQVERNGLTVIDEPPRSFAAGS